jgi:hypothetical protein
MGPQGKFGPEDFPETGRVEKAEAARLVDVLSRLPALHADMPPKTYATATLAYLLAAGWLCLAFLAGMNYARINEIANKVNEMETRLATEQQRATEFALLRERIDGLRSDVIALKVDISDIKKASSRFR